MRAAARLAVLATASLIILAGCSDSVPRGHAGYGGPDSSGDSGPGQTLPTGTSSPPSPSPTVSPTPTTPQPPSRPVTIAFAGDVHFETFLAARLEHPQTAMGPLSEALARADLSIVNLETAVTTRGSPQPKEYRFRAPPVAFTALKDAGIDVATMGNNHALDYGPVSVPDALAAAKAARMPVIGIGEDAEQAYRPWIATVHGQRIAFLAATAVMDPSSLAATWSATRTQAGVATALDGDNAAIVAAVRDVRPLVDTVVVELHYGSDLTPCPTDIQRNLADDLVAAGADIVVGQHAHILLGAGYKGSAYVDYGMGNFEFYVPNGGETANTGVLVLTVQGRQVTNPTWIPGEIVDGLPTRLTGVAAAEAASRWNALRPCAGLSRRPTPTSR